MLVTEFPDLNGKKVAFRKYKATDPDKYKDIIGDVLVIIDKQGELYAFITECDGKTTRIKREYYKLWHVLRVLED